MADTYYIDGSKMKLLEKIAEMSDKKVSQLKPCNSKMAALEIIEKCLNVKKVYITCNDTNFNFALKIYENGLCQLIKFYKMKTLDCCYYRTLGIEES